MEVEGADLLFKVYQSSITLHHEIEGLDISHGLGGREFFLTLLRVLF